jgi:tetratricopeptide (TPR) repeat protein
VTRRARQVGISLALAAGVAYAFAGVRACGFLAYDDDLYVTANPLVNEGLSLAKVGAAFTSLHAYNWHPLTWLSHMLDVSLFGMDPAAHHEVSVALHALNAVLVFLALSSLTGTTWRAAFAAALFALHPLRVESVAWIAERKDVLCATFGLAALWVWPRWARDGSRAAYAGSLALFALGLMAKPMLVTFPFLLLLLDYWPLGRLRAASDTPRLALEKLPFLALALGSSAVTLFAQSVGITPVPLATRIANAAVAYQEYLRHAFDPRALAVLYPYRSDLPWGEVAGAVALVLGVTALALWQAKRRPWLLVGWLWFAGMLVPTLGVVQVGLQAYADRYTYLPGIGIGLVLAFALAELAERAVAARAAVTAVAVAALAACVVQTRQQITYWQGTVSLFQHALEVTRDNWFAHGELGIALASRGDTDGGKRELVAALAIYPSYARAMANLGLLLSRTDQVPEGLVLVERALALDPRLRDGQLALGSALDRAGRYAEAEQAYRRSLELQPDQPAAALQLARLLAGAPQPELRNGFEALALWHRACDGVTACAAPAAQGVLAMIQMEVGDTLSAVSTVQLAAQSAAAQGNAKLSTDLSYRLDSYRRGVPVRLPAPRDSAGSAPRGREQQPETQRQDEGQRELRAPPTH